MDRRQQNENDILLNSQSRFSQEERARMSRENFRESVNSAERDRNKSAKKVSVTDTFSEKNNRRGGSSDKISQKTRAATSERKKSAKATSKKKEEGSLNDRMKKSSEARRKNSKLKNNTLFAVLVLVVVTLCTLVAAFMLRVNVIEVAGSERYSDATILEAIRLDTSDSMLLLNLSYLESKLEQTLPYVESATITRVWPDRITVEITDARPTLAVDTGDGYILMNNSCKVLDTDSGVLPVGAALIRGVDIEEAQPGKIVVFDSDISIEELTKLATAFDDMGLEGVSEYDLSAESNIVLVIDHRIEVKLGTLAGADEKLAFGKYVIEKTIEENPTGVFIVNISADGKAYVRDTYDNNVNFDEPSSEEESSDEEAASEAEGGVSERAGEPASEEESGASFG